MPRNRKGKVLIQVDDIVGRKIGRLEVVEYAGHWCDSTLGGQRMRHKYTCKCECGTVKQIRRSQLLNEIVHSCGCIKTGRKRGVRNGN